MVLYGGRAEKKHKTRKKERLNNSTGQFIPRKIPNTAKKTEPFHLWGLKSPDGISFPSRLPFPKVAERRRRLSWGEVRKDGNPCHTKCGCHGVTVYFEGAEIRNFWVMALFPPKSFFLRPPASHDGQNGAFLAVEQTKVCRLLSPYINGQSSESPMRMIRWSPG